MFRFACVFPTLLAVLLVEITEFTGFVLPVPFFIIIVCVVIAGSMGGQTAGFISALFASAFVYKSYLIGFGPPTLTGGLLPVSLGAALFILLGSCLGRLREQRDIGMKALRDREMRLETSLHDEIAERERQAAKVAESEARLKTAVRIAGIGHFSYDVATGNCTYCSDQYAKNFGMTASEYARKTSGKSPDLSHIHADDRPIIENAIARLTRGEDQVLEYRALHPDKGIRHISEVVEPVRDASGRVVANTGTSIDLTDLRRAEARTRQSQRIEAIGTLTGGVAHDFNNILAVILGNLELSLEMGRDDDWEDLIGLSIEATKRGAGLTKNLLSFSRRAQLDPKRANLNQNVQVTVKWGARVLPETISIDTSLQDGLWDIEVDETSLDSSIINILLNARDAMPEGGKVTIETANMRVDDAGVFDRDEAMEPGRYVMLTISDTGHGIPPEKLERIFEPFFTDKDVGLGSGLGLSMVYGFIKQSGGAIRVCSEPGIGTTFKLYFKAAAPAPARAKPELHHTCPTPTTRKRILFAEDDREVMRALKRILEQAGYSVTTASTGDEALAKFKRTRRFDLLLTDVVMPGGLQGPALAKAIRRIDRNMPCVFLSGYASDLTIQGNGLSALDVRLTKPVGREDLLGAVASACRAFEMEN